MVYMVILLWFSSSSSIFKALGCNDFMLKFYGKKKKLKKKS